MMTLLQHRVSMVATAAYFAIALLLAGLVGGCANLSLRDSLTLVLEAATIKVDRTTEFYKRGVTARTDAEDTLKQATAALGSLDEAQKLIAECAVEKCDAAALRRKIGLVALDRWEEHLRRAGDTRQAESVAAVRIAVQLMQPGQPVEGDLTPGQFDDLVKRFRGAVDRLSAALKS